MNDLDMNPERRLLTSLEIANLKKKSRVRIIDIEKLKKDDLIQKSKTKLISD